MGKFITSFEDHNAYQQATFDHTNTPNVSLCEDNYKIYYTPALQPHDYSQDYLTFTAIESGTFTFSGNNINYSLDNGSTWVELESDTNTPTISAGDKITWKSTLTPASSKGIGTFSSTGNFSVEGNAMSLLYGDNFVEQTSLSGKNDAFESLFSGCNKMISAENMLLPATTLSDYCYYCMFYGCTSLTTAPELPATTLTLYCYSCMFQNCTNLMTAPQLPAKRAAQACYYYMFHGCISLTTAPELPATVLASNCYRFMFKSCTNLTTVPSVLPATTLAQSCYSDMFSNCTSLTTAPVLPATTLAQSCYYEMFSGCTSLNNITCLATDISASSCTNYWVEDVAANGTFTKAESTDWRVKYSTNGIPSGWTVQNAA